MINFEYMTAMPEARPARNPTHVRQDARWNSAALLGDQQKCDRSFGPGGGR